MTYIYRERPSIVEYQGVNASTQARNVQVERFETTEKSFSFFTLLKDFLVSSTKVVNNSRIENRKKFPSLFK